MRRGFLDDLGGGREDRRRRERELVVRPEVEARLPVVPYVPFLCPECGRAPRTYGRRDRTRYHRCDHCGLDFRSREMAPRDVDGFQQC